MRCEKCDDHDTVYRSALTTHLWKKSVYYLLSVRMRDPSAFITEDEWNRLASVYYLEIAYFDAFDDSKKNLIDSVAAASSLSRNIVRDIIIDHAPSMVGVELREEDYTIVRSDLAGYDTKGLRYLMISDAFDVDFNMLPSNVVLVNSLGLPGHFSLFNEDGSLGIVSKNRLKSGVLYGGVLPRSPRYCKWILKVVSGRTFVFVTSMDIREIKKINPVLKVEEFHSILIVSSNDVDTGPIKENMRSSMPLFPYRREYMPPFASMYSRLKEIVDSAPLGWALVTGTHNLGVVKMTYPYDYEQTSSIADHFAEEARIVCKEGDHKVGETIKTHITPYDAWVKLMMSPDRNKVLKLDQYNRREAVYAIEKGCSLFSTILAVYVLWRFAGEGARVLDPSSGWGDRLISSCVADVDEYVHFDPNPNLSEVYKKQYEECVKLGTSTRRDYYPIPFEDASEMFMEGGKFFGAFDMVFTSPPFLEKEIYTGVETSTERYKTEDAWYAGFFDVLVTSSFNALKRGGWLALYLPEGRETNRMHQTADRIVKGLDLATRRSRSEVIPESDTGCKMHRLGYTQLVNGVGRPRTTFMWCKS